MCCGNDTFRITPEGVLQYRYNGEWVSVTNIPASSANDINAEVVQDVLLTQVPGGEESFIPESLTIVISELASLTSNMSISVGITGPGYTDILGTTAVTANATGEFEVFPITSGVAVPAGTSIYLRISTAAVAGTYTFSAALDGRYVRL